MTTILSHQEDLGPSMLDVKYEGLGDTGLVTTPLTIWHQTSLNVTSVTVELPEGIQSRCCHFDLLHFRRFDSICRRNEYDRSCRHFDMSLVINYKLSITTAVVSVPIIDVLLAIN